MRTVFIDSRVALVIPNNYERIPLPYFNAWIDALKSGDYKQAKEVLYEVKNDAYCCLGVLSKIQGRLIIHEDGKGYDTNLGCINHKGILAPDNPCNVLGCGGTFPAGITVIIADNNQLFSPSKLTVLNDSGIEFNTIAAIIKHVWKPIDEPPH